MVLFEPAPAAADRVIISLPAPVVIVLVAPADVVTVTVSSPVPVVILWSPETPIAVTVTAPAAVLVTVCAPAPASIATTVTRFAPLIVWAPAKAVAITVVGPEPEVIFCAPAPNVTAFIVAMPVYAVVSIVIAPASDVAVRFTPAASNAVSKKAPEIIIRAPPVVVTLTSSIFVISAQMASGNVVAAAPAPTAKFGSTISVFMPATPSRISSILNVLPSPTPPLLYVPIKVSSPGPPSRLSS